MAKLSVEVSEELEALQAIFGSDYQERPPVWNYPSFAISIRTSTNSVHHGSESKLTVRFQLSASYPKTGPKYEIEQIQGLSGEEKKSLNQVIEDAIKANLNDVMIYEIVSAIQNFIDNDVQSFKEESFYDSMMRREQEQSAYIENLKKGTIGQAPSMKNTDKEKASETKPHGSEAGTVVKGTTNKGPSISVVEAVSGNNSTQGQVKIDVKKSVTPAMSIPVRTPMEPATVKKSSAPPPIEKISEVDTGEGEEDESDDKHDEHTSLFYDNSKSRYSQEFQEITQIGNGASGEVWKVKHKLDRRIYAVKKIDLNARNNAVGSKIQREVTTISRLIHKNVVRYYAAWIEQYEATKQHDEVSGKSSRSSSSSGEDWIAGNSYAKKGEKDTWTAKDNSGFSITFDASQSENGNMDLSNFGINHTIRPYYEFDSSSDESDSDSDSDSDDSSSQSKSSRSNSSRSKSDDDIFASDSESEASQLPKIARWMFIQMEYCCTTLRAEIDKSELWSNSAEINRLLRQMLEALAYMHKCKVIHRDLKPANIFLDAENNIKVGDFGLATTGNKRSSEKVGASSEGPFVPESVENSIHTYQDMSGHSGIQEALDSLTAGIGTALYRAPEQELVVSDKTEDREYHVPYNEKADMYSLGIILFEMCHKPFETGMERLVTIKDLREKGKLPTGFEMEVPEYLIKIIRWLTQANPQQRPTAQQLLNSDLMPARADVDSQYLKEITEALYKPNSAATSEILSILFECDKKAASIEKLSTFEGTSNYQTKSLLYDYATVERIEGILNPRAANAKTGAFIQLQQKSSMAENQKMIVPLHHLNAAKKRLRHVFESRGGVDFYSQLLELRSTASIALNKEMNSVIEEQIVEMLDPSGQVVVLQPDLLTTYTRLIAFLNITSSQRFCFDRVFATEFSSERVCSQPVTVDHAVYDVVTPAYNHSYLLLADVEVLSTVKSILNTFQSSLPPTAIRVSHSAIEDVIISICCWDGESAMKDVKVSHDNKSAIKKILTQIPECYTMKEVEAILSASSLSPVVHSRLLHFGQALYNQDIGGAHDPFRILKLLETEFYAMKEITLSHLSNVAIDAKDIKVNKDFNKNSVQDSKEKASKSSGKPSATADFTPINLDHIGVKSKTSPAASTTSSQPATSSNKKDMAKPASVTPLPTTEDRPRRDRGSSVGCGSSTNNQAEIVKEWAKLFERGLQYLKDVLRIMALQKSIKDMCNANTSSTLGDLSFLENNLEMKSSSIILDFGVDSIPSPFSTHPYFQSEGLRFIVESYTITSSSTTKAVTTDSSATAAANRASGKRDKKKGVTPQTNAAAEPHTIVLYKRFKRNIGYWMDGGHFEKLIYDRRSQLDGRHDLINKLAACGLRIHMENLISVIHKTESRNRSKNSAHSANTTSPSMIHHKSIGDSERLIALVVNPQKNGKSSSSNLSATEDHCEVFFGPNYSLDAKSLSVVTNWLQTHHIRASYNVHQLQGYMSVNAEELCRQLEIPVLVTVDAEHYDQVEVQLLQDGKVAIPQSILLQQVPSWIKANVKHDYFRFSYAELPSSPQKPSASPLQPGLTSSVSTTSSVGGNGGNNSTAGNSIQYKQDDEVGSDRIIAVNVVTATSSSDNDLFSNKKKKKDLDVLLVKLSSAFITFHVSCDRLSFKAANEVVGKSKYTGIVEVVEVPLSILRSINTMLMAKSSNPTAFKAEFDALVSQDACSSYRKILKNYLSALINVSQTIVSKFSEVPAGSGGTTKASAKAATPAKQSPSAMTKQLIYSFSPIDEYMDSLMLVAEHIVNLRGIL